MSTVVLHNGHLNVDQNPDAGLHGEYGAAGELKWIMDFQALSKQVLEARGYTVKLTDGRGPGQDFTGDLFIADHYDGSSPDRAYFNVAHYQPDSTAADADKLCNCLIQKLDAVLPYPVDESTVTINETKYYGFTYESQADAIIEWGNGPNATSYAWLHDPTNMQACANARADAIDMFFGVSTPVRTEPSMADVVTWLSVLGDDTYDPAVLAAIKLDPALNGVIVRMRMRVQSFKRQLGA